MPAKNNSSNGFKAFKDFKKWSVTYQLLAVLIILISIPVTVLLVRSFALYLSRAAGSRVYWGEGQLDTSTEAASIDLTQTEKSITVKFDTGTVSGTVDPEPVTFFQVKVLFDNSRINLSRAVTEQDLTPVLRSSFGLGTTQLPDNLAGATPDAGEIDRINAAGEFVISIPVPQGSSITGVSDIVRLFFVATTGEVVNLTDGIRYSTGNDCLDENSQPTTCTRIVSGVPPFNYLTVQHDSLAVNLNPSTTPSCNAGEVMCNGQCIDPNTNNLYCGASGDCLGGNAGTDCTGTGASCVSGACVAGNAVIVSSIEDTYVDANNPGTSFASSQTLLLDGNPHRITYIKFDLGSVANVITKAELKLNTVSIETGTSSVQNVKSTGNTTWTDSITYNTRSLAAPLTTIATFTASSTSPSQLVDVTNHVVSAQNSASKLVGFAVNTPETVGFTYSSAESGNPAQLILTLADTPVATPTPTNTPAPTNTPIPTATPIPSITYNAPDADLFLSTSTPRVAVGQDFVVNVNINSGVNQIIGTEMIVTFPQALMTAGTDVLPGVFFPQSVEAGEFVDNGTGNIEYTIFTPPDTAPVQGQDVLAQFTFTADAVGTARLDFVNDGISTIVGAADVQGNALQSVSGLTIEIVPTLCGNSVLPGDITGPGGIEDCTVNLLDYNQLFQDFHLTQAQASDPDSDINNDGIVNILDYVILFENFGKTVPGF